MAKTWWPGVSLCVCAGALLGAAATLVLPPSADVSGQAQLSDDDARHMIALDIADIELAARRVTIAAFNATKTVTVKAGDTMSDVLTRAGVARDVALNIVDAVKTVYNPRRLQSGQALTLNFIHDVSSNDKHLGEMTFELAPGQSVEVARGDDGSYSARKVVAETRREKVRYDGVISSSLFAAADDAGVPTKIMSDMVKLFSYDVDFQRDIQEGDTFSVMYERIVTTDGRVVSNDGITLASMNLSGSPIKLYAFRDTDGTVDYYNEKGEGVRKGLLRTPINGARLTSGFGARMHPILGYTKMHQGIDFGAPTGTPVFAAGDGVIEKREFNGGYGNYIRIRHSSGYATAYAHLSRFAAVAAVGRRVRQNDIIGYVGTTGRSTGPHLHYEVLRDNRPTNPMTVKLPASNRLEGAVLARFKDTLQQTDRQYASLAPNSRVAMLTGAAANAAAGPDAAHAGVAGN